MISDLSQSKKQMTQKCKIYIFCFARQTIHVIVMIKNDIEKKKEQNQEGQYSSKQFIQIAGHKTFTTMSSKLSLYEHSQT